MTSEELHTSNFATTPSSLTLHELISSAIGDFHNAGLRVSQALVERYVASLLTKRFVILTGLSGSGKTRLAQSFAAWITGRSARRVSDWPEVGAAIRSERISYHVEAADSVSILFTSGSDPGTHTKVALPRELIQEWADYISANSLPRSTPVREIREAVGRTTRYSPQLNSFETHLKAAAFDLLGHQTKVPDQAESAYEVVAVGADWNSNEQILGYPDALNSERYVRTPALDLILRAAANPTLPHFLILDEMNLSHVERYFADFLSAIESGEEIHLYNESDPAVHRDGVPQTLRLPSNLFTIGTVNIDETTYMFSPKVLDRANTIEFRVSPSEIEQYLLSPSGIDLDALQARGTQFADAFLAASRTYAVVDNAQDRDRLSVELLVFFEVLSEYGYEFGFRTVHEISRFVAKYALLKPDWNLDDALDAQVYQKLLPRLNGSRARLEPVILSLLYLCRAPREWERTPSGAATLSNRDQLVQAAMLASKSPAGERYGEPMADAAESTRYPQSLAKLLRMHRLLHQNGFTSFAEA